ncbi:unnamed protein product [Peronospora belbahrii]|uniref:Uncharacterized protein n=1 Tax=Peronospora belbahrii TaxID=622444 RepID=A0AAU9L153_9STRA|nr:unnamed protein product [Peronospora belbahrii]
MSINTFSFSASTADKDKITRDSSSRIFTIFNYAPQLNAWKRSTGLPPWLDLPPKETVHQGLPVPRQLPAFASIAAAVERTPETHLCVNNIDSMQDAHAHKKKYCHCARLVAQFSPYVVVWQGHMLGFVCRQNTWKNVGSTR